MAIVQLSNPFLDIANLGGNMALGKNAEDKQQQYMALEQAMQRLREAQAGLDVRRAGQQDEMIALDKAREAHLESVDKLAQDKADRAQQMEDQDIAGLRAALHNIYPKMPGIDSMGRATLEELMASHQQGENALAVEEARRRETQAQNITFAQKAASQAQVAASNINRQVTAAYAQVRANPMVSMALMKGDYTLFDQTMARMFPGLLQQQSAASQNLIQAQTYANSLIGMNNNPIVQRTMNANLPYAYLSQPEQQQIQQGIISAIKTGRALPLDQYQARQIPFDAIAASIGYKIDPLTGAPHPGAAAGTKAAPPTATGPQTYGSAALGGLSSFLTSGPTGATDPLSKFNSGINPPPVAPAAAVMPTPSAPIPAPVAPPAAGTLAPPAPRPSVAPSAPPPAPAPVPAAPAPGPQTPAAQTQSLLNPPMRGQQDTAIASPAAWHAALAGARSAPEAVRAAKALMQSGADFNEVVNATPFAYRSMVSSQAKRIPTSGEAAGFPLPAFGSAPISSLFNSTPQFSPPNGQTPPLFSPPGT